MRGVKKKKRVKKESDRKELSILVGDVGFFTQDLRIGCKEWVPFLWTMYICPNLRTHLNFCYFKFKQSERVLLDILCIP